jgi:hypothetical protein
MSFISLLIGRMKTPFVDTALAVLTVLCVAYGKTINSVLRANDTSYRSGVAVHENLPWGGSSQ